MRLFGDPLCQSILGTQIDDAIGELLVSAVTPMALELTLAVQQEIQRRVDDADRLVVDDEQRRRVLALATEFPTVWRDPNTPERERMLALLVEDVTLSTGHRSCMCSDS